MWEVTINALIANELKECKTQADRNSSVGCVDKDYHDFSSCRGCLFMETPYRNGKKNGVERSYYADGNLMMETPYQNGKRNGIEKTYNTQGKLSSVRPVKEDKVDGVEKMYHDNGMLLMEILWRNGKKNGVEKWYYQDGSPNMDITYENSKIIGIKCYNGRVFSNAHIHNLNLTYDYGSNLCEQSGIYAREF